MLTLHRSLKAALLGVCALAGAAGAQNTPDQVPAPGQVPDPNTIPDPMTPDPDVDVDVDVAPPPAPAAPAPAPTVYVAPQPAPTVVVAPERDSTLERYGIGIALGGGVEGFTDDRMRSTTTDGGAWNVRLAIGTRSPLGVEVAYVGSAQAIDALGLDNDTVLVSNGAEGNLRLNFTQDMNIQPFATAGLGWRRYDLANTDVNTSAVNDSDDVLEIPIGIGVAWKYRGFLLDARGVLSIADQPDLVRATDFDTETDFAEMHRWGVNANLGYAF